MMKAKLIAMTITNTMLGAVFFVLAYVKGWDIEHLRLIDLEPMSNSDHAQIIMAFLGCMLLLFIANILILGWPEKKITRKQCRESADALRHAI